MPPHPNMQKRDYGIMIPRVTSVVFVGKLSCRSLHAKIEIFKETHKKLLRLYMCKFYIFFLQGVIVLHIFHHFRLRTKIIKRQYGSMCLIKGFG
jgi:hypothetical protein